METFHNTAQIRWSFSVSKIIVPDNKYLTVHPTETVHKAFSQSHFRHSQLLVRSFPENVFQQETLKHPKPLSSQLIHPSDRHSLQKNTSAAVLLQALEEVVYYFVYMRKRICAQTSDVMYKINPKNEQEVRGWCRITSSCFQNRKWCFSGKMVQFIQTAPVGVYFGTRHMYCSFSTFLSLSFKKEYLYIQQTACMHIENGPIGLEKRIIPAPCTC